MRTPQRRHLGVWTRQDLFDEGRTSRSIARLVDEGDLIRCGAGWYAGSATPADVLSALTRGSRLTCVSALRHHGLWVPLVPGVHAVGRRRSRRSGGAAGGHHRCRATGRLGSWPDSDPILPVREALVDASRCLDVEDLAVVLESALNLRILHREDLEDLLSRFPAKVRQRLGRLQTSAQSGTETRVRRHLEKLGVSVLAQHRIEGVGYVDMLVGEILIVECDSKEHHTGESAYQEDRRRDLSATVQGYRVVRFTWSDVELRWGSTAEILTVLVRRGLHRAPKRRKAISFERDE